MKTILSIALVSLALALSGCATAPAGTPSVASQVFTPANIAAATKDSLTIATTMFLSKNPTYAPEIRAAADVFTALAATNPSVITAGDISAALGNTSISKQTQADITAAASVALQIFEANFSKNLPGLKPQYALFAKAIADGLNGALPSPVASATPAS